MGASQKQEPSPKHSSRGLHKAAAPSTQGRRGNRDTESPRSNRRMVGCDIAVKFKPSKPYNSKNGHLGSRKRKFASHGVKVSSRRRWNLRSKH